MNSYRKFCNKINKRAGGIFVLCRVEFSKISKREGTFIREMTVTDKRFVYDKSRTTRFRWT